MSERENRKLYMEYMRGWRDGAGHKTFDAANQFKSEESVLPGAPESQRYDAYSKGFNDGHISNRKAGEVAARLFNYSLVVIKPMDAR